jgi:hypothetical protein
MTVLTPQKMASIRLIGNSLDSAVRFASVKQAALSSFSA